MKKTIIKLFSVSLLAVVFTLPLHSKEEQVVKPAEDIKSLFDKGYYQEIVDQYASQPRSLSADDLACVAESYFHLSDMINASMYADMSVQKNSRCARAYYVKGSVQNTNGNMTQAMTSFKKAISLSPGYADAYSGLGDVFLAQDNTNQALANFRKAASLTPSCEKAFYMIGVIHAGQNELKNALDTFYVAKNKIVKDRELLVTVLYNIGKMEFDSGRYTKAVEAYEELVGHLPDDYYSYEKLVQCYNALGLYDHAKTYRSKLYDAYKAGQLATTSISDNFCIDQFKVGNADVFVYERYEDTSCRTFVKDIFYVMNDAGEVDSSIFMEYVPSVDDTTKGEFKFARIKGVTRYTYDKVFPANVSYARVRPYIEDIIIGKVQPVASN